MTPECLATKAGQAQHCSKLSLSSTTLQCHASGKDTLCYCSTYVVHSTHAETRHCEVALANISPSENGPNPLFQRTKEIVLMSPWILIA